MLCVHVYVVCFFFSSRRRHTRCALVTGVQTCALPISETQTPFKPEKQRSFELGTKSMWLDQRVVLNAAVYYNKARALQESIFLGSGAAASSVRNAGKATIYGAELEGQIALWSGSRLGFNYAYLQIGRAHV